MPGIDTGISLRLPSFLFPSSPHLCLQWAGSLRLSRKPDGFEAPPFFIPWRHKMAYKFIVDGRWMTNDAEPKEVDHGFINNVYIAPPKPVLPEPELQAEPSTAPPSYHSESEVEHEPAEKVAEKPATNGTALTPGNKQHTRYRGCERRSSGPLLHVWTMPLAIPISSARVRQWKVTRRRA